MSYIVLLDPSLDDNEGKISSNLGDLIINESITEILNELFPDLEIKRISTHSTIQKKEKDLIKKSYLTFVGGTNILTSNVIAFNRLVPNKTRFFYLLPGFSNIILLGCGWNIYSEDISYQTKFFYKKILNKDYYHSLRDTYSKNKLETLKSINILNTCCPTTWKLNESANKIFNLNYEKVLLTLTDYSVNIELDTLLIKEIINNQTTKIIFFPQGKYDLEYLTSLEIYKQNKIKFEILAHSYIELNDFMKNNEYNYIGTRLHCGIKAMQNNMPSLIIELDNRAIEISKDTNLFTLERNNILKLRDWIEGKINPPKIRLPHNNINTWKEQFK